MGAVFSWIGGRRKASDLKGASSLLDEVALDGDWDTSRAGHHAANLLLLNEAAQMDDSRRDYPM